MPSICTAAPPLGRVTSDGARSRNLGSISLKAMARSTTWESAEISDLGSISNVLPGLRYSSVHLSRGDRGGQPPESQISIPLKLLTVYVKAGSIVSVRGSGR